MAACNNDHEGFNPNTSTVHGSELLKKWRESLQHYIVPRPVVALWDSCGECDGQAVTL